MRIDNMTTADDIRAEIERVEKELESARLTRYDREGLHDYLNYLFSFLPREIG